MDQGTVEKRAMRRCSKCGVLHTLDYLHYGLKENTFVCENCIEKGGVKHMDDTRAVTIIEFAKLIAQIRQLEFRVVELREYVRALQRLHPELEEENLYG